MKKSDYILIIFIVIHLLGFLFVTSDLEDRIELLESDLFDDIKEICIH